MRRLLLLVLLLLVVSGIPVAKEEKITVSFSDADIREVATFIGKLVNKNVVVDPAVKGKITLILSKPLSPEQVWNVFTSALFMQGYGVVDSGETVSILPINEAIGVAKPKEEPSYGELSILIYGLKNVFGQETLNSIRPFLSPFARVSVHAPSNTLIVADIGENIRKARTILKTLDNEEARPVVKVYRLDHVSSRELASLIVPLNSLFTKRYGSSVVISSGRETNTLVVFAPQEVHNLIEEIIEHIDTEEVSAERRSFYIIPLNFISAEDLYESLKSLLSATGRTPVRATRPTAPRQIQRDQKGSKAKGKKKTTRRESLRRAESPITLLTTKEGMKIGFDRGTNSVIVYATRREYENLKELIGKLDIRRKQVLIAATIVEASTRNLLDIGVRWQIIGKRGGAVFGGSSTNEIYSSFLSGNFLLGFISDVGRSVSLGDVSLFFPDLVLLFSLLETGSGFNIVSNPRVLTLDNQPAVIKVGQVIPYAEGVKFDINGQPIITYDYKEVGLELNVLPRISGENLRLTINLNLEEIIDFVTNQIGATSYTVPVTSNREINSDVVVENGQTVILGGLVSKKTLKSVEGVPGLMNVPLVGRLFRRDTEQEDKTSLFIFITPYIISSPEELAKITEEHKKLAEKLRKKIREVQQKEKKKSKTRKIREREEYDEDEEAPLF